VLWGEREWLHQGSWCRPRVAEAHTGPSPLQYVRSYEVQYGEIIEYLRVRGHKDLSINTRSYEDHDDFVELLCVSDGSASWDDAKQRNLKEVPTMCTVKFKKKGISILSLSDFCKVLGETKGRRQVVKFCRNMDILVPGEKLNKLESVLRLLRRQRD
jgi:hypothetical protein